METCRKSKGVPYSVWLTKYFLIDSSHPPGHQLTKFYDNNLSPEEAFEKRIKITAGEHDERKYR